MNYRKRKKSIKKKIAAGRTLTESEMKFACKCGLAQQYLKKVDAARRLFYLASFIADKCSLFTKILTEYLESASSAFELVSNACRSFTKELDETISQYK